MSLPSALTGSDDSAAIEYLTRYFGSPYLSGSHFTGALFDSWDPSGQRDANANRFTADDLLSVAFLSVDVPARAAHALLVTHADTYNDLLKEVGPDRDLVDEPVALTAEWPAWRLEMLLRQLPKVGSTVASKLLARKRPRLLPIRDSVITKVLNTRIEHLNPVRVALRADGHALHHRLLHLRRTAGIPDGVSALRILDVVAWMEGKNRGF